MNTNNFALIGSPASGKSSLAVGYAKYLKGTDVPISVVDIDEDVLTPLIMRKVA